MRTVIRNSGKHYSLLEVRNPSEGVDSLAEVQCLITRILGLFGGGFAQLWRFHMAVAIGGGGLLAILRDELFH